LVCERWYERSVSNKYSLSHTYVCSGSFKIKFPHQLLFHRSCYIRGVAHWLLTVLAWVQSHGNSCDICSERTFTGAGFPPGTLVFSVNSSSLGASTPTVGYHFEPRAAVSSIWSHKQIPFKLHQLKIMPTLNFSQFIVFFCYLWFSSVPPGKCQDSTLIRPWPIPNSLQFMNHSVLYSEPLTAL
jgi:hypothetical protein